MGERRVWEKEVKVSQRGVSGMCLVLVLIPVEARAKCNYGATEAGNWG